MGEAAARQPCQIYLAAPADVDARVLANLLARDTVAALLLYGRAESLEDVAREVVAIAHAARVPVLIANAPELARRAGADGVHIPANEERYAACRQMLGADAMIGAGCGTSRHDALVLGEMGADYLAFGPEPGEDAAEDVTALVAWWQEVCEPPVVGWHSGGWDAAAALIDAGADFIGVSTLIWDADDPATALDKLNGMIAERQRG
jgi:thiamine-phosphate pyrophosphorylase